MQIFETDKSRHVRSENYNFDFNKENGFFARWGKTKDDDPQMAPMPEILDLEISQGKCSGKCPECYKCNGDVDYVDNMSFKTFRRIFHKVANTTMRVINKDEISEFAFSSGGVAFGKDFVDDYDGLSEKELLTKQDIIETYKQEWTNIPEALKSLKFQIFNKGLLTQIAFGICDLDTNPDFIKMMKYCREFDVVPNFTFNGNGLTEELADEVSKLAGAIAISVRNKEKAYNSVKMLTDRTTSLDQVVYVREVE